MAEVEFEEQQNAYFSPAAKKLKQTKLVRLAIKLGLAKDEHGANLVFAVISVFCLIAAILICAFFVFGYNPFATQKVPEPRMTPAARQSQVLLK